jgi:hypothetical protein
MKVLILLLVTLLSSSPALAELPCEFKYRIVEASDVRICSISKLSADDIIFIDKSVKLTRANYSEFLMERHRGMRLPSFPKRIDISIVDREILNTHYIANKRVLGMYYPGTDTVIVDIETILQKRPILIHEVVHLVNFQNKVLDRAIDEELAYAFEDYIEHQGL